MKKLPSVMRFQKFFLFPLIACICYTQSVTANDQNNLVHQQVIDAAENFVIEQITPFSQGRLEVRAMPIDKRLDIPQCPESFEMSASDESLKQSNVTVKASCPSSNWYLYLIVKTAEMQPVVVLNTAVSPGTILTTENTRIVEVNKKQLRTSTFSEQEDVLGARLKRRTRAGQPIIPGQLCFVCKGDKVQIAAQLAGLQIKTTGVAQQDGNVGDTITVKNSRSNKLVHGKVQSTDLVTVQI